MTEPSLSDHWSGTNASGARRIHETSSCSFGCVVSFFFFSVCLDSNVRPFCSNADRNMQVIERERERGKEREFEREMFSSGPRQNTECTSNALFRLMLRFLALFLSYPSKPLIHVHRERERERERMRYAVGSACSPAAWF